MRWSKRDDTGARTNSLSHLHKQITSKYGLAHKEGFDRRHDRIVAPIELRPAADLVMLSHGKAWTHSPPYEQSSSWN